MTYICVVRQSENEKYYKKLKEVFQLKKVKCTTYENL